MRLIDADALLDIYERNSITDKITIDGKTIMQHLNDAPTIDAAPVVHAEWSYTIRPMPSRATYDVLVRCSKCNRVFERLVGRKIFSYCPNCGAKMDGERKDK